MGLSDKVLEARTDIPDDLESDCGDMASYCEGFGKLASKFRKHYDALKRDRLKGYPEGMDFYSNDLPRLVEETKREMKLAIQTLENLESYMR